MNDPVGDKQPLKKLEYFEENEHLKEQLFTINNENYTKTKTSILSSIFMNNCDRIKVFFDILLMAVSIRTGSIDLYVQLTKDLLQESEMFSKNMNISLAIDPLLHRSKILNIRTICCFYYKCYENKLFSFNDYIKEFFEKYIEEVWITRIEVTAILFFWFEPECINTSDWGFQFPRTVDEKAGNLSRYLTIEGVIKKYRL